MKILDSKDKNCKNCNRNSCKCLDKINNFNKNKVSDSISALTIRVLNTDSEYFTIVDLGEIDLSTSFGLIPMNSDSDIIIPDRNDNTVSREFYV